MQKKGRLTTEREGWSHEREGPRRNLSCKYCTRGLRTIGRRSHRMRNACRTVYHTLPSRFLSWLLIFESLGIINMKLSPKVWLAFRRSNGGEGRLERGKGGQIWRKRFPTGGSAHGVLQEGRRRALSRRRRGVKSRLMSEWNLWLRVCFFCLSRMLLLQHVTAFAGAVAVRHRFRPRG